MFNAESLNKTNNWDIDTTDFQFISIKELIESEGRDAVYTVRGAYINPAHKAKGIDFAPAPIIITDGFLVNLPAFMTETIETCLLADLEAVEAVKSGKVGMIGYKYKSHGKECFNVRFVNI